MHVSSFSVICTKYVSGSYLVDSQADWHSSTSRLYRSIASSMSSYMHLNILIIGAVSISWIGCTACLRLGFLLPLFWSLLLWYGCLCSLYGRATLFNLFFLASTNLSILALKAASSRFSGFTRIYMHKGSSRDVVCLRSKSRRVPVLFSLERGLSPLFRRSGWDPFLLC